MNDRINSIDMCRGMLFILMTNTHALGLARITPDHWARSDLWLPNGWATIVFVVLSGYAAGYLLSERKPEAARNTLLRKRALQIFLVMFFSNIVFAVLREIARGETESIFHVGWYVGFITLSTEWTISGVLLPTGFTLLAAPWVMRLFGTSPKLMVAGLLLFQLGISLLARSLKDSHAGDFWLVKFLLLEGFGGFPLLPFLINGCIGIALGMTHRRSETLWMPILGVLTILQTVMFFAMMLSPSFFWSLAMSTTGATAKFGCMFLIAIFFVRILPKWLGNSIELIGRFALGSFVMHRVFMQALVIIAGATLVRYVDPTASYIFLFLTTVFLTWMLCALREKWPFIDHQFKVLRI